MPCRHRYYLQNVNRVGMLIVTFIEPILSKMKYRKEIAVGVASGLVASWIKSLVEPPLQEIGEKYYPPTARQSALYGADVKNHPEKMPPAILADDLYNISTKKELSENQKIKSLKVIHYTFGALIGIGYSLAAKKNKKVTTGDGVIAGAAIWGLTHGSTLPAMGLQGPVKKMPKSWWVWELGSHLIFGATLETSRRLLSRCEKKE